MLEKYSPKMFVFENVPGLLTANKGKYFADMKEAFNNAGYEIDYRILNAKNFGVPQNRERLIYIGNCLGIDNEDRGSGIRNSTKIHQLILFQIYCRIFLRFRPEKQTINIAPENIANIYLLQGSESKQTSSHGIVLAPT